MPALDLAIFDLNNTLLDGDSDKLWGDYLVAQGAVDRTDYEAANERFYADYQAGTLDIDAFLAFALQPLADHDPATLAAWRADFMARFIEPRLLVAGQRLIETHRRAGDALLIITATNRFVTAPIAAALGIDQLLATEPAMADGRYTGGYCGTPTFREGKIDALQNWLQQPGAPAGHQTFYSDSMNDLPLLEWVDTPVAVDPDPRLATTARTRGWQQISLRDRAEPE